jgi:hypothetical protein
MFTALMNMIVVGLKLLGGISLKFMNILADLFPIS